MQRRGFGTREASSPPNVHRIELTDQTKNLSRRATDEPVQILSSVRGCGVTHLLERLSDNLNNDTSVVPVVLVADLSRYGQYSTTQALVLLRNQILERFDKVYAFSALHAAFIAFDAVATTAWRRKVGKGVPMEPSLYRSKIGKRLAGAGKIVKGAMLAEILEGASEALGFGSIADTIAQETLDKVAQRAIENVWKELEADIDNQLMAELRKGDAGKSADMEMFLPKVFMSALEAAAALDKSGAPQRKHGDKPVRFTLVLDSADEFEGAGLPDSTIRVRDRLGGVVRRLAESEYASVVIGGREQTGFKQFPQWRKSIGGVNVEQTTLGPIARQGAMETLKAHGLDQGQIDKILVAVSPATSPVHAGAFCEAYREQANLPEAVVTDRARSLAWAVADGLFERCDLERHGTQLMAALDAPELEAAVDAAWTRSFWSSEGDKGRMPAWHVPISRDLFNGGGGP